MKARQALPPIASPEIYCDEFRKGASYTNWRPQGSGDWLLIYTTGGAGRLVSSRGAAVMVRPGELVLYDPQEMHDYSTDPGTRNWHLLWAHFTPKPHWQAWLRWPVTAEGFRLLRLGEVHDDFRSAMQRMLAQFRRPHPLAREMAMLALEEALLWARLAAFRDKWVTMDERIRRAIDYLTAHYREPFRLDALAERAGISVSRLAHLFKAETGLSPQRYLEQQRMQVAGRLLRLTGLTVQEVAAEVGYDDPFYFSNRFRRHHGQSPRGFRAQ